MSTNIGLMVDMEEYVYRLIIELIIGLELRIQSSYRLQIRKLTHSYPDIPHSQLLIIFLFSFPFLTILFPGSIRTHQREKSIYINPYLPYRPKGTLRIDYFNDLLLPTLVLFSPVLALTIRSLVSSVCPLGEESCNKTYQLLSFSVTHQLTKESLVDNMLSHVFINYLLFLYLIVPFSNSQQKHLPNHHVNHSY